MIPTRTAAIAAALLVSAACPALAQRPAPIRNVRDVDFKNHTYTDAGCAGEDTPVTVTNGSYEHEEDYDKVYFAIVDVVYGDLTGDGADEAVVQTLCNTGGTGQFSDGMIYTVRQGRLELLTSLGIGDRADGGIEEISIRNGVLYVSRYGHGEGSGACCPEWIDTESYRWNGKAFVESGKPSRHVYKDYGSEEGPAPHRVRFLPGTSAATLTGTTNQGEAYVVGARKGQTLGLHFDTKDAGARLEVRAPDGTSVGTVTAGGRASFELPLSGDFRVAISSNASSDSVDAYYSLDLSIR